MFVTFFENLNGTEITKKLPFLSINSNEYTFSVKFTASNSMVIEDVGEEEASERADLFAKSSTPQQQSTESSNIDHDSESQESNNQEPTFLTVTAQIVNLNGGLGFQVSGFENRSFSDDEIDSIKQIARDKLLSHQVDCSKNGEEPPTSLTVQIPLPLKNIIEDKQPLNAGESHTVYILGQ